MRLEVDFLVEEEQGDDNGDETLKMPAKKRVTPVRLGMIGAGFVGQLAHLANYTEVDGCQIVALAELRPELRHRICQRYNIPKTYATHTELLGDPEVEAVVVVTARSMTGPIVLDCLNAGKHVMSEKPMAGTVEQATRLVEAAQIHGARYAVGYVRRHDPGVQRTKKMLDDLLATKELGPIRFARAHNFMGDSYANISGHIVTDEKVPDDRIQWPIAPEWMPEPQRLAYARFLNTQCHSINLLRYLFNQTPGVEYARLDRPDGQVVILNFGQFTCILEAGRLAHRDWDDLIEVYFERGRLRIEFPPGFLRNAPARVELYKGKDFHETRSLHGEWVWAFRRQAESFVQSIREGNEPLASGSDALEDMRLVEVIWQMEIRRG